MTAKFLYFYYIFLIFRANKFVNTSITFVFDFLDAEMATPTPSMLDSRHMFYIANFHLPETNQIAKLNFGDELSMINFNILDHLRQPLSDALKRKKIPLYEYNRQKEMLINYREMTQLGKVVDFNHGDHHFSVGFTGNGDFSELFAKNWKESYFNANENPINTLAKNMGQVYNAMPSLYKQANKNGGEEIKMPRQNHLVATAHNFYNIGIGGGRPTTVAELHGRNIYAQGYDKEKFRQLLEEQGFGQGRLPRLSRQELQRRIGNVMDKYFYDLNGINANFVSRSGVGTIHIPDQKPIKFAYKPEMDWKMSRLFANNNELDLSHKGTLRRLEEAVFNLYEAGQFPQFSDKLKTFFSTHYNQGGVFKMRIDQIDDRKIRHQNLMEQQMRTGLRRTNSIGKGRTPIKSFGDGNAYNGHVGGINIRSGNLQRSKSLKHKRLEEAQTTSPMDFLHAKRSSIKRMKKLPPRNANPNSPPNRPPTPPIKKKKIMNKNRGYF